MTPYFGIIQTLCRAFFADDKECVMHNIQTLAEAYRQDGHLEESKSLERLLKLVQSTRTLTSSVISTSHAKIIGETLTTQTIIPVDKETAAPLLEVIFPEKLPIEEPIFTTQIQEAVNSVIVEWANYSQLIEMNATPSRSCLIYGLPGTGKTHLAKWLAKRVGLPIVLAKLDGIVSSFLGTSSRNISNLFSFANKYKCILLLDEFDAIAKLRNDPQEVGEVKRIVNTLLQCLDSRNEIGFTIGVTNHEQLLDPAIWRRFDVQIEIPKPSKEVIYSLLKKFTYPIEYNDTELFFLSWCLQEASGADIQKLTNWLKRMQLIPEYRDENLIDLMRRYILLNTGRISTLVKDALSSTTEEIYQFLAKDNPELKKKDFAELFNMTPSSFSKLISKKQ